MEITRKNFTKELENITYNLKRSCFIAFDAEFTSLFENHKHGLFETNEERYNNIRSETNKIIMMQVGLTAFQYDRDNDAYNATSYTFHLCPRVLGEIDQTFQFQASTLKFLCDNNFNFNKFTYEGVPYLSLTEENKLRKLMQNQTLASNLTSGLTNVEERQLQHYCMEVRMWLNDNLDGTMYIDQQEPILKYLVHTEVRLMFPNVLTTNSLGNSNKILIYRNKDVVGANSTPLVELENDLIYSLLGFSKIMRLLGDEKKPLVGHNIFMDTILLHNQFIGPLPKQYSTFKNNINRLFPVIFDTKFISYEMSRRLTIAEVWQSNSLQDLYEFFSGAKCKRLEKGLNYIKIKSPFNENQSYHEAGWDSYCTGYCFIRLSHWVACENIGNFKPISPTEMLAAMEPFCNKVNVIRGAVPYMNLIGRDPPTHRPHVLYVKSLKERIINLEKVVNAVAGLGVADVRPYGSRAALIAAGTHHTANKILKTLSASREYRITTYKAYIHSPAGRFAIWSGALITGGLLLVLLHKRVNK